MFCSVCNKVIAVGVMLSLFAAPSLASASATPPVPSISPMVALSIFGSRASATALCGARSSAVSASVSVSTSASASAQAPVSGCVLPLVDAPAPVSVAEPLVIAQPIAAVPVLGITPILVGLAGIAVLAGMVAGSSAGNDNDPPVSVN